MRPNSTNGLFTCPWRSAMHCEVQMSRSLSMLVIAAANLLLTDAQAADPCSGHKMLQAPRPELSCRDIKLQIYPSPDGTLRAVVYPADISLDATPDMESRVVIRTSTGETLTSKDYSHRAVSTGTMSSMQNGRRIPNSLFTACRPRAVTALGNFQWLCTAAKQPMAARRTSLLNSAT